jgi:branched-chain amino acid transport system ATP-binding protein
VSAPANGAVASTGRPVLLALEDLHVAYDQVPALRGIDLVVHEGELVVLLGPNGAGKTTTLRTIARLEKADRGRITFAEERVERWSPAKVVGAGAALVPEGRQIFPDHTVEENLQLGGYRLRRDRTEYREALDDVLTLFPRLKDRLKQMAGTLSGGEAQMLAVARALMSRPRLLMLDEPSLGLAPQLAAEMFGYLRRLSVDKGLTILLVEQQAALALRLADRGYVLGNGEVLISGPSSDLREDPQVQAVYLGGTGAG